MQLLGQCYLNLMSCSLKSLRNASVNLCWLSQATGFGGAHVHTFCLLARLPTRLAGRAVSLAMVSHWICNFAIGQLFLSAVSTFGVPLVYLFFAAVCFACCAFVARAVVETKGRRCG